MRNENLVPRVSFVQLGYINHRMVKLAVLLVIQAIIVFLAQLNVLLVLLDHFLQLSLNLLVLLVILVVLLLLLLHQLVRSVLLVTFNHLIELFLVLNLLLDFMLEVQNHPDQAYVNQALMLIKKD
jgi:hypothetical protein